MVALAILAGALLALSDVVAGALRNHVRARQLDVATLLARGRMAGVEEELEREGFRDFDQEDEGTFEEEGHPEIHWKLRVRRPALELGPESVLRALTGSEKGLQELLPSPTAAPSLAPAAGMLTAMLQATLAKIGEDLKKGVREVRLTVSWSDAGATESFDVVTHLVVTKPTGKLQ
jgi:general secretion pathway protein I